MEQMSDRSEAHRLLASSYAHLGDLAKARHHAKELIAVHPNFSITHWRKVPPDQDQEPLERLIEGLRKAGLRSMLRWPRRRVLPGIGTRASPLRWPALVAAAAS